VWVLDPRTGAVRATRTVPLDSFVQQDVLDPLPATAILAHTVPGELDVDVFRIADGATVASGDLVRREPAIGQDVINTVVTLAGSLIVVAAVHPDQSTTVYAFDARTLVPVWHTEVGIIVLYGLGCATQICLTGDGGTAAFDPATGKLLGLADWRELVPVAPGLLVGLSGTSMALVGPDLTRRLDLDAWTFVTAQPWPVLVRPGGTIGDEYVAVVDPAAVGGAEDPVHPLGTVHVGAVHDCRAVPGYLVCYGFGAGVVVLTLP
jgi:hypothetical protein